MSGEVKREWFDHDYYAVLGVAESASHAEITKAYRKLARTHHPDKNPGDAAAEDRFKEISAAYDVIGDEKTRADYDQARRMGPMGGFGRGGGGGAGGFDFNGQDLGDLSGLLGNMFGGGFGDQGRPRARKGRDQEARLSISFDEAMRGTTTTLSLSDNSGDRSMKVRIPSGVESGQRIRLRGKGGHGNPPGDLYVIVAVEDHALFGRDGKRLTLSVPITFVEAALGADIEVPTYAGSPVTVRIPAGTQHGRTLRVRGAGVSTDDGDGDLLVTVTVAVPANLSPKERDALETLAALSDESPRRHLEAHIDRAAT